MTLKWYTFVVAATGLQCLAAFWNEVLDWRVANERRKA